MPLCQPGRSYNVSDRAFTSGLPLPTSMALVSSRLCPPRRRLAPLARFCRLMRCYCGQSQPGMPGTSAASSCNGLRNADRHRPTCSSPCTARTVEGRHPGRTPSATGPVPTAWRATSVLSSIRRRNDRSPHACQHLHPDPITQKERKSGGADFHRVTDAPEVVHRPRPVIPATPPPNESAVQADGARRCRALVIEADLPDARETAVAAIRDAEQAAMDNAGQPVGPP